MKIRIVPAIQITLKPSFIILGCYVLLSMLSLLSLIYTTLPLLIKCVIAFAVIIASIYTILQDALLTLPWSWHLVEVTSQGKVRIHNRRGDVFEVVLLDSTVSHPWLTILRFRALPFQHGLRSSLMMTAWNIHDPQQYRKLRVWLNWGKPNAVPDQPLDGLPE